MGLNDLHGEPISTSNRRSLDRFEHATDLLSGLFADPLAVIDEALEEDPGFVIGDCMRAGLMLMAAEKSAQPELRLRHRQLGRRLIAVGYLAGEGAALVRD